MMNEKNKRHENNKRMRKKGQASSMALFVLTVLLVMLIILFYLSSFLVRLHVNRLSIKQSELVSDGIVKQNLFWLFLRQPFDKTNLTIYDALLLSNNKDMGEKIRGNAESFFLKEGYNCFFIKINESVVRNCRFKSGLQKIEVPYGKSKALVYFGLK